MFLTSLLLVSLVAVLIVIDTKPSIVEQEEFIPVPIRTDQTTALKNLN